MQIRPAEKDDIPELVELWVEFMDFHSALDPDFVRSAGATERWAGYVSAILDDPSHRVLVATEGAVLAGYTIALIHDYPPIWSIEKSGLIQEIAVRNRYRRRGIARRMLHVAEEWLKTRDVPHVEVRIDIANKASRSLFSSAAFKQHTETLIKKY